MISSSTLFPKLPFSSSSQNLPKILSLVNLLKRGFSPTVNSLNHLLLFLSKTTRFQSLLSIYSQMHSNKIKPNSLTFSILSSALLKQNESQKTEKSSSYGSSFPEIGIWDSLIQGICNVQKDPESAFQLLRDFRQNRGISFSASTFYSLILFFSSQGKMDRAIEVLELIVEAKVGYPFNNLVSSSIISGFCRIGKPKLALEFYENAVKNRFFRPNVVTYTATLDALCREGRISDVCDLICRMEKEGVVLDAVFYSSWISAHFREGLLHEAFLKHRLMMESGTEPDSISYTILIDGFSKEGNVEKAVGLLNEMEKRGLKPTLITYTAIMHGFCKKGKLEEAFGVFRKVEEFGIQVDEVMYAVLIDGLCRYGEMDRSFHLLEEMEERGIGAGIVTYNTVINGLCKAGKIYEADEISKSISGDNFTMSTLIHGYIKMENVARLWEVKRRLEEASFHMDVVTCNLLIKALFMIGRYEDAYLLYEGMRDKGLVASSSTYHIMIDGYCKVGRIDEALEIFDECRRGLLVPSVASYNCIIRGLCNEGMVDMAIEVFDELVGRGLVPNSTAYMTIIKAVFEKSSEDGVLRFLKRIDELEPRIHSLICNDALTFLCKKYCSEAAYNMFMGMWKKGLVITSKSFYLLLKRLIHSENKQLIQLMLNAYIKGYGIFEPRVSKILVLYLCKKDMNKALWFLGKKSEKNVSISVLTAVIEALLKGGRFQDAFELIMEAEETGTVLDVVVYSIVVDGLCKEGFLEEALDICAIMRKKGIRPNIVTYNSVINVLCRQGRLVEAFRLFDSLERNDLLPTVVTYDILISALSKEGFLQDANELFKRMVLKGLTPNTRVYNLLINGYCKFGLIEDALKIFFNLEKSCLQPDAFTVSALVSGYCHIGDMGGALAFLSEFKRKGLLPDFLGFVNLIKGLCSKGRMEEARSVLREMLQSQSVTEMIDKAGDEIEMESLSDFLCSLCEQGSVQEATNVLHEVGSMLFPLDRPNRQRLDPGRGGILPLTETQPRNLVSRLHVDGLKFMQVTGKKDSSRQKDEDNSMSELPLHDFNSYYSVIASHCSKGELHKADRVVKEMILDLGEYH